MSIWDSRTGLIKLYLSLNWGNCPPLCLLALGRPGEAPALSFFTSYRWKIEHQSSYLQSELAISPKELIYGI